MDEQKVKNELNFQNEKNESFYEQLKRERLSVQQRVNQKQNEGMSQNSIKEIATDVAQRVTPSALDKIVELVNSAKRTMREKRITSRIEESKDNGTKLSLEEIVIGDMQSEQKIEKTENDRDR